MNRRNFIKNGTFSGLSLSALSFGVIDAGARVVSGEGTQGEGAMEAADMAGGEIGEEGGGRGAVKAVADEETGAEETALFAAFPLQEITIDALQEKMQSGELSSRDITKLYLQRISAIDRKGPVLNAVIELNPDALSIADGMDAERRAGKVRGPLHGIPVLIKDNIDSGDRMMTTAGSLALEGHRASKDAFMLGQLRAAGAVLLGKTNLSEWANFRSSRSTSGWSSRGGQTKNPYMLARNPSGSSAGSGCAVSANLCAAAVGTETNGSVVSPSSICGIVGIKPTVGLVSRSGIIPISATQDTAGPMARTVKDAVILLGGMTGADEEDAVTLESRTRAQNDYTKFLDAGGLKGKRIGIEKSFLTGHEGIVALLQEAINVMNAQGATIVEVELVKLLNDPGSVEGLILQYEFKEGLNKYLGRAGAQVKTLADVIAFNRAAEKRAMPYFKQETLERSEARPGLDSTEYSDALQKLLTTRTLIDELLKSQQLDAISGVTSGPACCIDLIAGDYRTGSGFSSPAAMAGYPHITVPMGQVMGLPVGISFMGTAYAEPSLISLAYSYEQATKKRVAPEFLQAPNPNAAI